MLEGAGFGSPRKLVAQFQLKDFAVFKVMFTAVIVAGAGLLALDAAGMMARTTLYVPTVYFWGIASGGALIGAGFAVGGYCPGTAVAGLGSGRIDALVFMAGMVAGVWIFAGGFDWLRPLYTAGEGPAGLTADQMLSVSPWLVLAAMVAMAVVGFAFAARLEGARGGPLTSADARTRDDN